MDLLYKTNFDFYKELTNNVRFTWSVGDTYTGSLQVILSKTHRIGDSKHKCLVHQQCDTFSNTKPSVKRWSFIYSVCVHDNAHLMSTNNNHVMGSTKSVLWYTGIESQGIWNAHISWWFLKWMWCKILRKWDFNSHRGMI